MSNTVLNLRIPREAARRVLRALAVAAVPRHTAPAPALVAEKPVPDPTGLFAADEMPPPSEIAAAAEKYFHATEQARAADRIKRGARKLLDRLPAGRYGMWQIERVANAREVADLDKIRAIFKAHGLGDVPMKPCAPSLKVGIASEEYAAAERILAEAGAR